MLGGRHYVLHVCESSWSHDLGDECTDDCRFSVFAHGHAIENTCQILFCIVSEMPLFCSRGCDLANHFCIGVSQIAERPQDVGKIRAGILVNMRNDLF